MLRIYGIKNCDTMKKAFAWLEKNGIAFDVDLFNDCILKDGLHIIDVRRDPRIKYVEGVKGLRKDSNIALEYVVAISDVE